MKRVIITERKYQAGKFVDTDCAGEFLAFGVDYEELEDGVGNFSVALVLVDGGDGQVESFPVGSVRFLQD